jgi:DNA ligase-1
MNTIKLIKKDENGKNQFWSGEVIDNKIIIQYGMVGGKTVTNEKEVREGKNIGKKNETSPHQQAVLELHNAAQGKIERGYLQYSGDKILINKKVKREQSKGAPDPMTAHVANDHFEKISNRELYIQNKFDGFRCVYDRLEKKLYSRSKKEFTTLPHLVQELDAMLEGSDFPYRFLDGELYNESIPFEQIASIITSRKNLAPLEDQRKIVFYCFDAFDLNGKDTFSERSKNVKKLRDTAFFKKAKTQKISPIIFKNETLEELNIYIDSAILSGYEGIMIRTDGIYEHKRSYNIFKFKRFFDMEGTCIGFKSERRKDKLGSITFRLPNGEETDARPAMTESEREYIWNNQKKFLGKSGTIKYQELSEKNVPRFPVFLRWRPEIDMGK